MNPFKELDYLVQARVFTKEILGELKYNNNKDEVFPIVKKRLNEKLKIIETNNLVNQIEISKCIEIESTMLHSDRYRNAYLRITSNKFEFVKVDNNKYVFDLEQIYEKVSRYDFNLALEEIIGTIYQENLIEVMK